MAALRDVVRKFDSKVEKGIAAYYNYGADRGVTLYDNINAFNCYRLKPNEADFCEKEVDISTTLLGHPVKSPVGIVPTAMHKLLHPEGEMGTTWAASQAGVCYVEGLPNQFPMYLLHTEFPGCLRWKNIYPCNGSGRPFIKEIITQCEENGISGLVFSVDNPNYEFKPINNPAWSVDFSSINIPDVVTMAEKVDGSRNISALGMFSKYFRTPDFTWDTYRWLIEQTHLPVIAKGVLTGADAQHAVDCGSAAVYVSNHGGRWMDCRVPTLWALLEVVQAIGDQVEVYVDGGVRSGVDVFKALALGARAVFLGRPIVWGLGADGRRGVLQVLEGMVTELKHAMIYTGCKTLSDVNRSKLMLASTL